MEEAVSWYQRGSMSSLGEKFKQAWVDVER